MLLDECVPKPLATKIITHTVKTTQEMGWTSKKNGELVKLAELEFDLFITADQNMAYQQSLNDRNIAILLLPTNRWTILSKNIDKINEANENIGGKKYLTLQF